jgi:flagellar motility protein MotE (MotC chaperone)
MKALRSPLVLALLAGLLFLGTTFGVLYLQRDALLNSGDATPEALAKTAVPQRLFSFHADEVDALAAELKDQREKLDARQAGLDKLATRLDAEKQELERTRGEIKSMRDEIAKSIPQIQESEARNLKTLAQTYSNMTPQAAVAIFREMDEMMTVKILAAMKADKVGAVLQEMARAQTGDDAMAKRAARISDKLRLLKQPKKETTQS